MKNKVLFITILFVLFSCKSDPTPKPLGYLNLEYPLASYYQFNSNCPFQINVNKDAKVKLLNNCSMSIVYPKMKATIYIDYLPIENNNLKKMLQDAQKLTFEHVIKADEISELPFSNPFAKVYGMFYKVDGNAATNSQFYVTDSTKHFVRGSLYFYAKPNFDSIYPATSYIKNDMQYLMESFKWKSK
jgi:gliding motility-associated lipoprotein GldD